MVINFCQRNIAMKKAASQGKLIIYTDGGSRGNPGPAALGVVFADSEERVIKRYSKTLGLRTNNEAEYEAVLFALQKARALYGKDGVRAMEIEVRMDSQLVNRQVNAEYKIEEERLWPLFMKIWNTRLDFGRISFGHIPRGQNLEADRLVNEALDQEQGRLL